MSRSTAEETEAIILQWQSTTVFNQNSKINIELTVNVSVIMSLHWVQIAPADDYMVQNTVALTLRVSQA